jgi:SecD/SecF fusion protein
VLLIGVCALCILAATPLKERLKGGIDIIGGSSFTLRIQERKCDDGEKMPITREQVEQAIMVIEKRLNVMGTAEPLIARQGADGILVQMPGVEPEESARIRETSKKSPSSNCARSARAATNPIRTAKPSPNASMTAMNRPRLPRLLLKGKDEDGNEYQRPILLNRRMALGGSDIANAVPRPSRPMPSPSRSTARAPTR